MKEVRDESSPHCPQVKIYIFTWHSVFWKICSFPLQLFLQLSCYSQIFPNTSWICPPLCLCHSQPPQLPFAKILSLSQGPETPLSPGILGKSPPPPLNLGPCCLLSSPKNINPQTAYCLNRLQAPARQRPCIQYPTLHRIMWYLAKSRCWIDSWLNECTISHPALVVFLDRTLCLFWSQLSQLWTEDNSTDVLPRCAVTNKPMTWKAIWKYKCYIIKIISFCIMFYLALYLGILCGFQNFIDAISSTSEPKFSWVINSCTYYSSQLLFPGILICESVIIWTIYKN